MRDEEIDKLIGGLISNTPIDASAINEDWIEMKGLLAKKKKKRFIFWIFFAGAGLTLFVLALNTFYTSYNTTKITEVATQKIKITVDKQELKEEEEKETLIKTEAEELTYEKEDEKGKSFSSSINRDSIIYRSHHQNKNKNEPHKNLSAEHQVSVSLVDIVRKEKNDEKLDGLTKASKRSIKFLELPTYCRLIEDFYFPVAKAKNKRQNFLNFSIMPMLEKFNNSPYQTETEYQTKLGYIGAVGFGLRKNRFDVTGGFNFASIGFDYVSQSEEENVDSNPDFPNALIVTTSVISKQVNYRASHLGVSLGLDYSFLKSNKFRVYSHVSSELNFLLKEQGLVNYASRVTSNVNLGVGTSYNLKQKLELFVQPNFRYMYSGLNNSESNQIKPSSLGLKTGIKFIF